MTDSTSGATPDPIEQTKEEWTLGTYPNLAAVFMPIASRLVDAADVGPGDTVLDVATGTGNVALTAALRGADVTGVDVTPAMLEAARERADRLDVDVDWQEGDAANLPYDDGAFDVTLSCLGHIFVPDAEAAGDELLRVTRPGGRVAFTAWTPQSGIAAILRTLGEYVPPPPDPGEPQYLWGDPETVRERFGDRVTDLEFETQTVLYPALSARDFWQAMTTDSGGVMLAVEAVPEEERDEMEAAVIAALEPFHAAADNAMKLEYLVVTAEVAE